MPAMDKVKCLLGDKCEFYNCDECIRNKYTIQTTCKKCGKRVDEDRVYPFNQGCIKCCSEEQFALFVMSLDPPKKKKKKVLVNADGVKCEKCNKKVPINYYLGIADDEMWVECIHTGWYCPKHSPTSNCDDDDCPCCCEEQVAIKNWDDKGRECWNCAKCGGWEDWKVPCCGKTKF